MKRTLLSIMAVGFVAILARAGSLAYFSDTKTSSGNTFTADTFDADLKLKDDNEDWSDGVIASLHISNWSPGENYRGWIGLYNDGTELAPNTIMHWDVTDEGGITTEAELDADPGNDINDLSTQIIVENMYYGWYHTGNPPPSSTDIVPAIKDVLGMPNADDLTVADLHCEKIDIEQMIRNLLGDGESHPGMEPGQEDYLTIYLLVDPSAGSEYQGDTCTADITFTIYQQEQ